MTIEKPAQIAFKADRCGKRVAYRWMDVGRRLVRGSFNITDEGRWDRIPAADADRMLADGSGVEVEYRFLGPA